MKNKILFVILLIFEISICMSQNPCNSQQSVAYGGLVYKIVSIGNQCWFAENLNIGEMIPGNVPQINIKKIEKYCYDNEESNCLLYGGLYQWSMIMLQPKKDICPDGWHTPTDIDFIALETFVGMPKEEANKTGSRGTNQAIRLKLKGDSGFEALLSGNRQEDGNFYDSNVVSYFWTSTIDSDGKNEICRYIIKDNKTVFREKKVYPKLSA